MDDKLKWNPLNVRSSIIVIVYKRLKAIFVISSLNTVFATSSYFLTHSLSSQSLQPKFLFQLFLFSWHDIPVTCQLIHTCFKWKWKIQKQTYPSLLVVFVYKSKLDIALENKKWNYFHVTRPQKHCNWNVMYYIYIQTN